VLEAYKFRIYPIRFQKTKMVRALNLCRWVYNETLTLRKNAWENDRKLYFISIIPLVLTI
jgi:putative transposase